MLFYGTLIDSLQMGLCFSILALGVYISYAVLDFSDLSTDATFPLGGVFCTILMLRLGINPLLAILLTFFAGACAGAVTGLLHVKLGVSKLLSGIIVMTAFLSINLALTQLLSKNGMTTTIFAYRSENLSGLFGGEFLQKLDMEVRDFAILAILLAVVIVIKLIIDIFLKTKIGYMLRSTGDNEQLVTSLGKNVGAYKILGLAIANGLISVSGALYSQYCMSYDNTSGSGKVVLALASVIIGLALFSGVRFIKNTTAVIFGAIIYSLCLNFLVLIDTSGIYLNLLNAVLFTLILAFNGKISKFFSRKRRVSASSAITLPEAEGEQNHELFEEAEKNA